MGRPRIVPARPVSLRRSSRDRNARTIDRHPGIATLRRPSVPITVRHAIALVADYRLAELSKFSPQLALFRKSFFRPTFSNAETTSLDSAAETHAERTRQPSFSTEPTLCTKPPNCYTDLGTPDRLLAAGTAVAVLVGIVPVATVRTPTVTIVGYGLVVAGLIVVVRSVRDFAVRTDEDRRTRPPFTRLRFARLRYDRVRTPGGRFFQSRPSFLSSCPRYSSSRWMPFISRTFRSNLSSAT